MKKYFYSLLFVFFLAGLITAFYGYVNWQAEKKWEEEVAKLKAKGEPTDWREVVPPAVPDSENFCATPLLAGIFDYTKTPGNSEPVYADPGMTDKINSFRYDDPKLNNMPSQGSIGSKTLTDLKKWQEYYGKSKAFPHPDPSAKATPAMAVILALNRHQKDLDELIQASNRPEARFAIHYEAEPKVSINLDHIGLGVGLSHILSLRASAYLQSDQSDKAWKDLQVILKIQQALAKEPTLISHLVAVSCTGPMLNSLWEGMALKAWSDAELTQISHRLEQVDFLAGYQHSIRGELIFFTTPTLDYVKKQKSPALAEIIGGGGDMGPLGRFLVQAVPNGCFDMAKVASVQIFYETALPIIDAKNRRYDFAAAARMKAEEMKPNGYSPVDIMLRLITPSVGTTAQKMVQTQTNVDMARIACALELFCRKNGHYPADLETLKQPLPNDIITGKPYFYQLTPNGRYQLWSVGWNEKNDLGTVIFKDKENKRPDPQAGDWVWAYPDKSPAP